MEIQISGISEQPKKQSLNNNTTSSKTTRRKLSIPLSVPQGSFLSPDQPALLRRRFSNVGDAVSRRLSTTIGWRTGANAAPIEEIIATGRALGSLYIKTKLKKSGLFNKKLGLTRVRSAIGSMVGCCAVVREVFPGFAYACQELERMYPKLYSSIQIHTGPPPGDGNVGLLFSLGHHILRIEPSWGKIIAIYCIAGGLAVDYVRQGQNDQLHIILEDISELLEDRIAYWVNANGGWTGLNAHCHPKTQEVSITEYFGLFGLIAVILLVAYFIVKFCVRFSG